eukprot:1084785-Amphidinium_carterae.2
MASAATPVTKKRSAMQEAFDKDASICKKPRNRADMSIQAQVLRAIADNVPFMSSYQLDVYLVNGKTGRQTITDEKERCRRDGGSTGSCWWAKFKADFGEADSHSEALSLAPGQTCPEPLWSNFKLAVFANSRMELSTWCASTYELTETEAKVLVKCLRVLQPRKNQSQYHCGVQIIECLARCDVKSKYKPVFNAAWDRIDEWLAQAALLNPDLMKEMTCIVRAVCSVSVVDSVCMKEYLFDACLSPVRPLTARYCTINSRERKRLQEEWQTNGIGVSVYTRLQREERPAP